MDDLGDGLVKVATDLVKASAILPVVGFGCIYCTIWLIKSAHGLLQDPPLYWLCFGLGVVFGSLGALTFLCFVGLQWRDRTAMHGGTRCVECVQILFSHRTVPTAKKSWPLS